MIPLNTVWQNFRECNGREMFLLVPAGYSTKRRDKGIHWTWFWSPPSSTSISLISQRDLKSFGRTNLLSSMLLYIHIHREIYLSINIYIYIYICIYIILVPTAHVRTPYVVYNSDSDWLVHEYNIPLLSLVTI